MPCLWLVSACWHGLELYAHRHTLLILCMSFMFCTVNGCDCQLIIKENYDDDDDDDDIIIIKN